MLALYDPVIGLVKLWRHITEAQKNNHEREVTSSVTLCKCASTKLYDVDQEKKSTSSLPEVLKQHHNSSTAFANGLMEQLIAPKPGLSHHCRRHFAAFHGSRGTANSPLSNITRHFRYFKAKIFVKNNEILLGTTCLHQKECC
jgi:hypothetical protein